VPRTKKDAKPLARDEEKENIGRQTAESRQHRRSGVLSATTTLGISSAKPPLKRVAKREPAQVKEKKLPLQDITSQFLPALESANRGAGSEGAWPIEEPAPNVSRRLNLLTSPLPPSSPPADLALSPVEPFHLRSPLAGSIDDHVYNQPNNCHIENDRQTSSSSDPFGFAALERKLKEERKFVTNILAPRVDMDDDIYQELQEIPVADTSSPRPVRRIKQPLEEGERRFFADEAIEGAPDLLAHPHFATPPTPRKRKHVQRRLSCEEDIFSPCAPSFESSPSPTKASANKRRRDILYEQDPLEEFNATVDESDDAAVTPDKQPSKRQSSVSQKQADEHHSRITWNLRPRRLAAAEKAGVPPRSPKDVLKTKSSRRAKSNSSKKVDNILNDDLEEVSQSKLCMKLSKCFDLEMEARTRRAG
jgi:hypothetical protein